MRKPSHHSPLSEYALALIVRYFCVCKSLIQKNFPTAMEFEHNGRIFILAKEFIYAVNIKYNAYNRARRSRFETARIYNAGGMVTIARILMRHM